MVTPYHVITPVIDSLDVSLSRFSCWRFLYVCFVDFAFGLVQIFASQPVYLFAFKRYNRFSASLMIPSTGRVGDSLMIFETTFREAVCTKPSITRAATAW